MNDEKRKQRYPGGDLHGTLSDGQGPDKKIKLFFSRRVWITVISFIGLTIIGGIIEFSVQTPISRFIERYTGPRVRTLHDQLDKGNYEFVYRNIKDRLYDKPNNEEFARIYRTSVIGLLDEHATAHQWDPAADVLKEAIEGMPISDSLKRDINRAYMRAKPEHVKFIKKQNNTDMQEQFQIIRLDINRIARIYPQDPVIQWYAGKTYAYLSDTRAAFNLDCLDYFARALHADSSITDTELLDQVLTQALSESAGSDLRTAQTFIIDHYQSRFAEQLHAMLRPKPFGAKQDVEPAGAWNKRINAFETLTKTNMLTPVDEFLFYTLTVAHIRRPNDKKLEKINEAKKYFIRIRKEGTFEGIYEKAALPRIVPASVLSGKDTAEIFHIVWPLMTGILAPIFEGYCHERLFNGFNIFLENNCYRFLDVTSKLSQQERSQWEAYRSQ
ncbi:MAG: hypothetical protein GF384_05235 [Elusimicrobia bacterium]|nr:hypothetical protein [Elusimicrobiota bacterium]MBD3412195.1 hypothetical protein [Elusimicrobiota bacterium]